MVAVAFVILACRSDSECFEISGNARGSETAAAAGASCVLGDLHVNEATNRDDLAALDELRELRGSLVVSGTRLQHLDGLDQLATVAGHVFIAENPALSNLAGLDSLELVGGSVVVFDNDALDADSLLPALREAKLGITLAQNDALPGGEATLPALESIGSLEIVGNASLETVVLPGFACGLSANIRGNESLDRIVVGEGADLEGGLLITDNPTLDAIAVGRGDGDRGAWQIFANPSLRVIEGFAGFTGADGIFLDDNPRLETFDAFPDLLDAINIIIIDNQSLARVDLFRLRSTSLSMAIFGNLALGESTATRIAATWLHDERVAKVGRNSPDWLPLDPCPWIQDGTCDAAANAANGIESGTGLCLVDEPDCSP